MTKKEMMKMVADGMMTKEEMEKKMAKMDEEDMKGMSAKRKLVKMQADRMRK